MDEQAATTAAYFIYHMQNHEAIRRTFPCYHDHEAFDRISGVEEDISISASLNCIYEVNNVILLIAFITTHNFFLHFAMLYIFNLVVLFPPEIIGGVCSLVS